MERMLREYERVAQKEHWCDRCCEYIQPGDMYAGYVYVTQRDTIMVLKEHIFPACLPPEEPEEYKESGLEETVEEELKRAA